MRYNMFIPSTVTEEDREEGFEPGDMEVDFDAKDRENPLTITLYARDPETNQAVEDTSHTLSWSEARKLCDFLKFALGF